MQITVLAAISSLGLAGATHAATVFEADFDGETREINAALDEFTITSGSVDVIGPGFFDWCGAGNGNCVDLNGSTGQAGRIESASLNLISGRSYTLSFSYGFNQNSGDNEVLAFGLGNFSGTINLAGADVVGSPDPLLQFSQTFTYTGGSTSLFFADAGNTPSDNGGPLLDNVMLSMAAVPLPAGGLLLLLGSVGSCSCVARWSDAVLGEQSCVAGLGNSVPVVGLSAKQAIKAGLPSPKSKHLRERNGSTFAGRTIHDDLYYHEMSLSTDLHSEHLTKPGLKR